VGIFIELSIIIMIIQQQGEPMMFVNLHISYYTTHPVIGN